MVSRQQGDANLRMEAAISITKWTGGDVRDNVSSGSADKALANLFGLEDYSALMDGTTDEIREKLRLLNGAHGYSVYKMLLARKGV